jgi:hypothetical protein
MQNHDHAFQNQQTEPGADAPASSHHNRHNGLPIPNSTRTSSPLDDSLQRLNCRCRCCVHNVLERRSVQYTWIPSPRILLAAGVLFVSLIDSLSFNVTYSTASSSPSITFTITIKFLTNILALFVVYLQSIVFPFYFP